jgi:hypothetical protein
MIRGLLPPKLLPEGLLTCPTGKRSGAPEYAHSALVCANGIKSSVLYRECGGAVVPGSKVVLIAAAFPIQLLEVALSDNGKRQDQNGQSGSSGIGVLGTSTCGGGR